jgi:hypothetical protein
MKKNSDSETSTEGRRRVRLHPREGDEHRFSFARRWEARRRSHRAPKIWFLIGLDISAVVMIYLVAREVLRRL